MKLLKKLLLALGLAGLSALAGAPALAADDDLAAIQKTGVIRIGTEGTYAPFTFHETSDNKLVGFDVDIGRAIAAKLGVKPEFVEGKWDGLIAGLNVNRYDVVINQVGISAERQAKYDFSRPYIASAAAPSASRHALPSSSRRRACCAWIVTRPKGWISWSPQLGQACGIGPSQPQW